ncbi:MAG TPA: hypothetical protein VFW73_10790 [Lacipirellulaceae bacterium]|nr:hypothetical protein [Lacipirellulaceae bacterium]
MTVSASGESIWSRIAPGVSLMILAPIIAEILPGATRFSAIFVLPIEVCVWGGGALLIRSAVRRWRLGWRNMLLLALALAVAEECIIQQTSFAPLVIRLKGEVYARAFGVNYVYLLWALVYESVFVVFVPIHLAELIFERNRSRVWVGKLGFVVVTLFFVLGSFLAWYSWTHIARPKVFHLPLYNPPSSAIAIAAGVIGLLVFSAIGPMRGWFALPVRPMNPPARWVLSTAACLWATLWYILVLLAFGIAPQFPPAIAVAGGLALTQAVVYLLPRWAAHPEWDDSYQFAIIFGTILGSMLLSFIGFIGSLSMDLYFKLIADAVAILLLIALGARIHRRLQLQIA